MNKLKFFPLIVLTLLITSCVLVPVASEEVYYSCGLVPEIDKVADPKENADRLYINNISGEKIHSVKLVYIDESFDEQVRNTEPKWSKYDNLLKEPINDKDFSYAPLSTADSLKTLWIRVDTSERHCVFAIVYEMGCRIDVNIRKSDT